MIYLIKQFIEDIFILLGGKYTYFKLWNMYLVIF